MKRKPKLETSYLFDYVPKKYEASSNEVRNRDLLLSFKKGENILRCARMIANFVLSFYRKERWNMTFICIPAASSERNFERFDLFCREVCRMTGMWNGFDYVHIEGERVPQHMWHHFKPCDNTYSVSIDDRIQGRNVLLFDDVVNTGASARKFRRMIEDKGGKVLQGVFLAKVKKTK